MKMEENKNNLTLLTRREHFAALAMQGLLSNTEWMREYKGDKYLMESSVLASTSVEMADKVLELLDDSHSTTTTTPL